MQQPLRQKLTLKQRLTPQMQRLRPMQKQQNKLTLNNVNPY